MKIFTSVQIKQAEEQASRLGMSHLRLMENAGSAAARIIRSRVTPGQKVVVVCGKGNNGGDGFVAARKLFELNAAQVTVVLAAGLPATDDAGEMFSRIRSLGIPVLDYQLDEYGTMREISGADLIVDAVFGIGFRGVPDTRMTDLFFRINEAPGQVVALDLPSGADCDTGAVEGQCVSADLTVAFTTLKPAHGIFPAAGYCGETVVADIGMPPEVLEAIPTRLHALDEDMIRRSLKPRARDAHKGDFGRALLFCGSRGMAGAAALAAKAALRCGVGLAELAVPESIYPVLASSLHEPIFTLLPETGEGTAAFGAFLLLKKALVRADALLMGCGLGRGVHLTRLIEKLLEAAECPVVLDADGINAIAGDINILKKAKAPVILTPHPGEMGRLLGISAGEVQESRLECARDFAVRFGVTLILKGANTIIASPDQTVFMNMTGNAGMAAGGSGDVLAGMVASFLAQGFLPQDAAFCATYLHGLAGDRCAGRLSQRAMLPSDLIEALPQAILSLEGK